MTNAYFNQIVSSFLNQNALKECCISLPDAISIDDLCKNICALSNTAALENFPYYYAFWGVDIVSRKITGTSFIIPDRNIISTRISTTTSYFLKEIEIDNQRVVVLEVQSAQNSTIQYNGDEYILRNGSLELLSQYPDVEQKLWKKIYGSNEQRFDAEIAMRNLSASEVVEYLDYQKLFEMLQTPLPSSLIGVMSVLNSLRFITEENTGKYNITNLGALLLARRLSFFKSVEYKAIRVLTYQGNNFSNPAHEQIGGKGYIVGFEGLIKYIYDHIPQIEYIDGALRKERPAFPLLSIRELVANAIIHQDLNEKGSPIISIFHDRIEISNPGIPMIPQERFIDNPPYSRNESLAAAMHKVGICEERGSGYDKVIMAIEENNLPAPEITIHNKRTSVVLKIKKDFDEFTKDELIQICYSHTCLNYIQGKTANNSSLRRRFGLTESERYKISRVFDATVSAKLIKPRDGTGPKNREYIPIWA